MVLTAIVALVAVVNAAVSNLPLIHMENFLFFLVTATWYHLPTVQVVVLKRKEVTSEKAPKANPIVFPGLKVKVQPPKPAVCRHWAPNVLLLDTPAFAKELNQHSTVKSVDNISMLLLEVTVK